MARVPMVGTSSGLPGYMPPGMTVAVYRIGAGGGLGLIILIILLVLLLRGRGV
jgi:hypothetical protein